MDFKQYQSEIRKNIFEDREGNIRMKLTFLCKLVNTEYTSYCTNLLNPGSSIRSYLIDNCDISPNMINSWVNDGSIQDILIGDILEYEGFVNRNDFAVKLNRVYRANGYRTHLKQELGLSIESNLDGIQRLFDGISEEPFPYELEFNDEFYDAVFLHYDYQEKRQCGLFIKTYIYNWFPKLVLDKLEIKNEPRKDENGDEIERGRKHKYHQFFKGEALRQLRNQIRLVTVLLNSSRDRIDFIEKMENVPEIVESLKLPSRKNNKLLSASK
jgi:hypothetical protein